MKAQKPNTMLLNKIENENQITFTVWTDGSSDMVHFIKKTNSIKRIPENLQYNHAIAMGYWINITVAKEDFEKVIADIKNVFETDPYIWICEDFTQKEWGADMLC